MPKVLAFMPTYQEDGKDMIRARTLECWHALTFDGELVKHISRVNPHKNVGDGAQRNKTGHENVLVQYQTGWQMAMDGGYDALLTVEHDMIFQPDYLQRLWDIDKPVAYGMYMLRHGPPRLSTWREVRSVNPGMSLTLFPAQFEKAYRKGVAKVSGVGFGFTLIRRAVLEQVGIFRRISPERGGGAAPDTPFARDCQGMGIEQWVNFSVKCGHIRPDGTVLWPPYTKGKTNHMAHEVLKFNALKSFNGNVEGQLVQFTEGDIYDLPANEEIADFIRAGYLSYAGNGKEEEAKPVVEVEPVKAVRKTTRRKKKVVAAEGD